MSEGMLPPLVEFLSNPAEGSLVCDPALTAPRSGSVILDKNVLPLDFIMTDFSDMEEKTRLLYQLGEGWLFHDEVNPILVPPMIDLDPRQEELDLRWQSYQPDMAERIAPFVRNVMINGKDLSMNFRDSRVLALDRLAEGGSGTEQILAKAALGAMKLKESGRVGKEKSDIATFGTRMKCTDYTAQSISIGALHFTAVDMGGGGRQPHV